MASKFNVAVLPYCPPIMALEAAFKEFAGSETFVLTEIESQGNEISATLNVDSDITVRALNRDDKSLEEQTVTKTKGYPFKIEYTGDDRGVLHVYAGSTSVYKTFERFFAECVNNDEAMTITEVEIDPLKLWEAIHRQTPQKYFDKKKREQTAYAKIVRAKFSNYEAKGDVSGSFNAKFKDSGEAREFIDTFMGNFKSMTVVYGHGKEKVSVSYGLTASFSIAAGAEVGDESVRWLLEDLFEIPGASVSEDENTEDDEPVKDDEPTGATPSMALGQ